MSSQQQSRDLLGMCLDEQGAHTEAQNVRAGVDLESYELELRLIGQLLRFGLNTPRGHELAALASQPQAPAAAVPEVTRQDVYTLIGHSAGLKLRGENDMPDYFMDLAGKLARLLGDRALSDRIAAMAAAPAPEVSDA